MNYFYQSNASQNTTAYSVNDVVMNEKILLKHLSISLYRLSKSENFIDNLRAKIKELNEIKSIGNDKTVCLERDLKQSTERLNSLENDKLNVENDIKLSKRQLDEKIDETLCMTENHKVTSASFHSYYNLKTEEVKTQKRIIKTFSERNEDENQKKSKFENQFKEIKNELDESIDFLNKEKREIELLETHIKEMEEKIGKLEETIAKNDEIKQKINQQIQELY
jgi:chromosome segregation ATPase